MDVLRQFEAGEPAGTKANILAAAEQLFSRHGIEGTSLRQISKLSGNRNLFAAQYHFSDKHTLIHSILENHAPELDAKRAQLLAERPPLETLSLSEILELMARPLAEYRSPTRERSFVRFLKFVLHYDPYSRLWHKHHDAAPSTRAIYGALRKACPSMDDATWLWKVALVGKMMIDAIAEYDLHGQPADISEEDFIREIVSIAAGALSGPAASTGPAA
jgi:AcrR family transcriptional regulator